MALTKKQRAQVVELLRCAADLAIRTARPIAAARAAINGEAYGGSFLIWRHALDARGSVSDVIPLDGEEYRHQILEAAARVEDCEWP